MPQSFSVRNLIRFAWLACVFGVTLEVLGRVDDHLKWDAPFFGTYSHGALVMRDSATIRGRPNYRYEKWRMNAHGFRGADLAPEEEGRRRIVVIGASETFGLFESEGWEYPARMQVHLDSAARGVFEVINAGLPGMSLAAMIPYLDAVIRQLNPEFVVLYPSPSFYLETEPPAEVFRGRRSSEIERQPSLFQRMLSEVRQSRLLSKTRILVKRLTPIRLLLASRERALEKQRAGRDSSWMWATVPAERLDQFERQLDRVVTSVEALGARPVLVTHANRFLHHPDSLTLEDRQHLLAVNSSYWPRATEAVVIGVDSSANARARRVAARRAVSVIQLERRVPTGAEYFADYSHFTDVGAEFVGRLLACEVQVLAGSPGC